MLEKITSFITGIMVAIGGFFLPTPVQDAPIEPTPIQEESLGAFSPVAGGTYRLKTSIGTSDTTIVLSSFTEPVTGNLLTMTTLATDIGYATIDPQSATRKEFVSFTGITQNADGSATLTGVTRGLGFQSPFTASSTLRKSHPGQSVFILSDSPQLFNEYARRRSNETITGQWTFSTFPITPSTTPASATTSGWVELATGDEAASSTLEGNISGYKLALHTGIATSSAPTSGNVVVVTGDDGNIDYGFLPSIAGSSTIRVYTASTTWSKPAFLKHIIVEVVGGGGGGGGGDEAVNDSDGNGGGGGGYAKELITADELTGTSTVMVSVGAGGTAGATGGGTGGLGTTTFFGNFLQATGGAGGTTGGSTDGGTGGIGSGGDINIQGGGGALRADVVSGNDSGGGAGGSSVLGGGGAGRTTSGNGIAGGAYGGGGGGGSAQGADVAGGAGAQGVVIITEYF